MRPALALLLGASALNIFPRVYVYSGFLRDVTGTYMASFMVAGSFLLLGSLTMATLPHFFSRTDPPPPRSLEDKEKGLHSELEQMNSLPSDGNHAGV